MEASSLCPSTEAKQASRPIEPAVHCYCAFSFSKTGYGGLEQDLYKL
jgi:hypothetical protein